MAANAVCNLTGIRYPVFQGAMTNVSDANLTAAVSNAGGLGILTSGAMSGSIDYIRDEIRKTKELTDKPFGVNIVIKSTIVEEAVELVCSEKIKVVTTGAGNPAPYIEKLKKNGVIVAPVIPNADVAAKMQSVGADMVIAEGMESGGFIGSLTTMALIPLVADAVNIPVVAAGGIADGRGMAAAFALGASGVQMGTRFLAAAECRIPETYKEWITKANALEAIITGSKLNSPQRVLKNAFIEALSQYETQSDATLEGYMKLAMKGLPGVYTGNTGEGLLAAGQIVGMIKSVKTAKEIIEEIVSQFQALISRLGGQASF